jgi:SAM-dependent methyltransferase
MSQFSPHRVVWTRDKSTRFWDVLASRPTTDNNYFSSAAGAALVGFARQHGARLSGRILDFGCGPGYLIARLLDHGGKVTGVDFSPRSIERVVERFQGRPEFEGAHVIDSIPTPFADQSFDTVFFIETIEHLLDDDLEAAAGELRRLTRKGGTVVISTPNQEDLEVAASVCPDCGCTFHPVQHVRSWSAESLTQFMSGFGFKAVAVKPLFLRSTWLRTRIISAVARLAGKRLPHLVYVGRRD